VPRCRGCLDPIGWIRLADGRAHPVERLGYAGIVSAWGAVPPGHWRQGYDAFGRLLRVRRPLPSDPVGAIVHVFETHFAHCPKAARFGRR